MGYQVLTSTIFEIDDALLRQLEEEVTSRTTLGRLHQVRIRLGVLFDVDPGDLFLFRRPGECLKVRLFELAGQPSAQDARRILEEAGTAHVRFRAEGHTIEFDRWQ